MSGLLTAVGALTLGFGVLFSLFAQGIPTPLRVGYAVGAVVTSLLWFALAQIVQKLDELQVMIGKPSVRGR